MKFKKYITVKVALFAAFTLYLSYHAGAQNKRTYNEEVTIIAPYEPTISDAFKINHAPNVRDTMKVLPKMRYDITPKLTPMFPPSVPFAALNFVPDGIQNSKRFYVRGGAGNYGTLYGELFAGSLPSTRYAASLRVKHLSSSGKIKDFANPQNSLNEIEGYASRFFEEHVLKGNAHYRRSALHWYGIPSTIEINESRIKQLFNDYGGEICLATQNKDKDMLNYSLGIAANGLNDNYKTSELNINVKAGADKNLYLFGEGQAQNVGLCMNIGHWTQKDSIKTHNSTIVNLQPFLKMKLHHIELLLGLNATYAKDTSSTMYFYPKAEARIELIPENLVVFGGFEAGNIRQVSLLNLYKENPFISPVLSTGFVKEKYNLQGGILTKITKSVNVNVYANNIQVENYPFFMDNLNDYRHTFDLTYDKVNVSKIKAQIEIVPVDNFQLAMSGIYNYYKLDKQPYAWYKPSVQAEFNARYAFRKSLIVNLQAIYNDKVWAPALIKDPVNIANPPQLKPTQLDAWLDLSIGGEFRYSKNLSFWLNLNNLTSTQYFHWYNYPSYKLNLLGGVSYSF